MGKSVEIFDGRPALSSTPSISSSQRSLNGLSPPRRSSIKGILDRTPWIREFLMLAMTAGVVIAITGILISVQDRELSVWKLPITTPALLSLLITILYLLLTSVLSSCLNQLRWLHFSRPYPLSDFEAYNRISQSAVSSILALTQVHKNSAMLVILIATLGPFVQQILSVHYETFVVPGNASMPIAYNVSNAFNAIGSSAPFASDAGLISAVYSVLANSRVDAYTVAPFCSTGNCTWPSFSTLAINSNVEDMSNKLEYVEPAVLAGWLGGASTAGLTSNLTAGASSGQAASQQIIRLPNTGKEIPGVTVAALLSKATFPQNVTDYMQQHADTRYSQRIKFTQIQGYSPYKNAKNATAKNANATDAASGQDSRPQTKDGEFLFFYIWYLSVEFNYTMTASGMKDTSVAYKKASAWKCKFSAVLQPMSGRMENGFTSETFDPSKAITAVAGPCTGTSKRCDLYYDYQGERHRINTEVLDRLAYISSMPFNDSVAAQTLAIRDDASGTVSLLAERGIQPAQPLDRGGGVPIVYQLVRNTVNDNNVDDEAPFDGFTLPLADFMANLARSQTSWLRTRSRSFVPGTVWRTAAVYRVQWGWIAVPVAIFFAIGGMVGYTAWRTRREGLPSWTDSTLAVAVHGLDDRTRAELAHLTNVDELERATQHINVRLCKDSYTLISDYEAYPKI